MTHGKPSASSTGLRRAAVHLCLILSLLAQTHAAASAHASAGGAGAGEGGENYLRSHHYFTAQATPGRAVILVRINPRRVRRGSRAGNGSAVVSLLDGAGNLIAAFGGSVPRYDGRAVGVRGPARNVKNGDTPFGVYRYTITSGGTAASRLGTGYGTGKVYFDDHNMFGEMIGPPRRSLIRLHGGGSGLTNPYAPNQTLRSTLGCVRMRNRDVNALIQFIKRLPADGSLRFVFMGSDEYLRGLANDASLRRQPWWQALRRSLGIRENRRRLRDLLEPLPGIAKRIEEGEEAAEQGGESETVELVKLFSEDEGELGRSALGRLRPRAEELLSLQRSLAPADPLRPRLAFVLCYLGRDCEANIRVLESAMSETSPYGNFPAELAAQMLDRLVDSSAAEGDEQRSAEVMGKLFAAAPEADGALSEELGVTFTEKLRTRTRVFFLAFRPLLGDARAGTRAEQSPPAIRAKVYELIRTVGRVRARDLADIRRHSQTLRESSQELREVIAEFTQEYLQRLSERRQRRRERQQRREP